MRKIYYKTHEAGKWLIPSRIIGENVLCAKHHPSRLYNKMLPNAGEEWVSSVSDRRGENKTEWNLRKEGVLPPPPIGLQHINWVWMDWRSMAERPLDCSAVRGIKIWNQLVLCLQTLTSAGRENQLRELKVEAATRKSFSTSSCAFISAGVQVLSATQDQTEPLSCLLRRGLVRGDFLGRYLNFELWPPWRRTPRHTWLTVPLWTERKADLRQNAATGAFQSCFLQRMLEIYNINNVCLMYIKVNPR